MNISRRRLHSVGLLSFLGTITFCNAAVATPPTYYILKNDSVYGPRVSGPHQIVWHRQ